MLSRERRLTSSRDFRVVFAGGKTYVHKLVILKVLNRAGGTTSRLGFSTSSKLGNAVVRNRAKRLLREAVRLLGERVRQSGFDAVLIARPPMREAGLAEVSGAVEELFRKAKLLVDPEAVARK